MIDYVARALAQKALSQSGGGTSVNTYSKDEIDVLLIETKEEMTDLVEENFENVITVDDIIAIDAGIIS